MEPARFIEFEIIKEPWNKYQLQDNSILKTRLILKNVRRVTKNDKMEYSADVEQLTVIYPDPSLRGDANLNPISSEEISNSIEIDDMRYDSLAQDSNEYKLDDGTKIKIHNNITSISRSSLKDQHGDPVYFVLSSNQVVIRMSNI